jgi:hypothetical protein
MLPEIPPLTLQAPLGIEAEIKAVPYGVPRNTPFADDTEHSSYDRATVEAPTRLARRSPAGIATR